MFGDLLLRKEGRDFAAIIEAADSDLFSRSCGISHEAAGNVTFDKATGEEIVDSIDEVLAVALVLTPATTNGLYESYSPTAQTEIDRLLSDARDLKKQAAGGNIPDDFAGTLSHVRPIVAKLDRRFER